MNNLTGCDELREWLISQGFKVSQNHLGRENLCNWYAYKRTGLQARECECNDGKPMQIVVTPYKLVHQSLPTGVMESVEVDVTGEVEGLWFKLQAYSLRHDELRERMAEIEGRLIAAWNALQPVDKT